MLVALALSTQIQLGPPTAKVGSIDDDLQAVHQVSRVVEDPDDGTVFVFQQGTPWVVVYDSAGEHKAQLGRRGGGPGEFGSPSNLRFAGPELWVTDLSLRKFVFFNRRTLAHERDKVLPPTENRTTPFAISGDTAAVTERTADDWVWRVHDRQIASYPTDGDVAMMQLGERYTTVLQPFANTPKLLPTLDGGAVIVIAFDRPRVGLARITLGGDTVYSRSLPIEAEPVTDQVFDEQIETMAASITGPVSRRTVENALRESLHHPAAVHRARTPSMGVDDVLWLGSESGQWHAIDIGAGHLLGTLQLPEGQRVMTGGRDHVWVLSRDELDVEYLTRHSIAIP